MVKEAIMVMYANSICSLSYRMDNSEWTRNGDFAPCRWENEQDAANIIC